MRIVSFDTATRATTAALMDTDTGSVTERRDDPPPGLRPRHTTQLMSLIMQVLGAGGCVWDDIDLIAVGVGPGTFTGLRIGVATARALAQARGIGLVGVSTLHSLAYGAARATGTTSSGQTRPEGVLAVLDARRREVFAAGWAAQPTDGDLAEAVLAPRALTPQALTQATRTLGPGWLMVGDGAIEFRTVFEQSQASIPDDDSPLHRVTAIDHCRLATRLRPQPPAHVHPEYLRLPDAELSLRASEKQ